jgi:acetylornithine deacetylase
MRLPDVDLLARLVAFDTTSHRSNLPLAEFLREYLDRPDIRTRTLRSPDESKANLLVEAGPEASGDRAGLVLSGHMDVVPAGEGWSSDPFALTRRDGRLVGRGACDMKGFLALAANLLLESVPFLRRPLWLLFTYDEETGTAGARRLAETWTETERLPRAGIVGEPTRLRVVHAHKGIVGLRVVVSGRGAHSGYPHLGKSAIEPAARIAVALAGLRQQLAAERPPGHQLFPEVPFVPLNIGTIGGGTAPNVVPDRCELTITLRPLPGQDGAELVARVADTIRRAAAGEVVDVTVDAESPAMATPVEAPVVRWLLAEAGGEAPATESYATDAGWLQRLGLQCVLFGPGDIAVAHRPDEFVTVDDLSAARRVLGGVIRRACGDPGPQG